VTSPHRESLLALLRAGASAYVDLDPRGPDVFVPSAHKASAQLTLEYGEGLPVPIPDLEVGQEGIAATLSFQRTPSRTFVPWSAVLGVRPGSIRPPSCALCGRARRDVEALVEGKLGAVCGECVGAALAVLDVGRERSAFGAWTFRAIDGVLAELPPGAPLADSGALLGAAFALLRGDPARIEALMRRASALSQPEWVLRASASLPAAGRSFELRKLRLFAQLDRLDPRAALAEMDDVDHATLDPRQRVELLVNCAAAVAELDPPDAPRLDAALREATRAIDALEPRDANPTVVDPRFLAGARRALIPTRARALLAAGALEAARPLLTELLAVPHARTLLVAGDLATALSGPASARATYERAGTLTHPESPLAALLRARLGG
jgi:hypothetical protein